MTKTGVLLHVYHLETSNWEDLVWGNPGSNKLGTASKFASVLLDIPLSEKVKSVIYSGPSSKNGMIEGEYTRKYLIDHLDKLREFPSLASKIDSLSEEKYSLFLARVENIIAGPIIKNTRDEMVHAAEYLKDCDKVFQVAAASHAPRCLQNQIMAKEEGHISKSQTWYIMPSDTFFNCTTAADVVILEPSHRGDDPMTGYEPSIVDALKPYFNADVETKKQLISTIQNSL